MEAQIISTPKVNECLFVCLVLFYFYILFFVLFFLLIKFSFFFLSKHFIHFSPCYPELKLLNYYQISQLKMISCCFKLFSYCRE